MKCTGAARSDSSRATKIDKDTENCCSRLLAVDVVYARGVVRGACAKVASAESGAVWVGGWTRRRGGRGHWKGERKVNKHTGAPAMNPLQPPVQCPARTTYRSGQIFPLIGSLVSSEGNKSSHLHSSHSPFHNTLARFLFCFVSVLSAHSTAKFLYIPEVFLSVPTGVTPKITLSGSCWSAANFFERRYTRLSPKVWAPYRTHAVANSHSCHKPFSAVTYCASQLRVWQMNF